jgi:histone deacetylase 11
MGLEKLHPFDARKFSKVWALLANEFGEKIHSFSTLAENPISDEELEIVHSREYPASLRQSKLITSAIEITALRFIPNFIQHIRECVALSCEP